MMKQKLKQKLGVNGPEIQGLYPEKNSCQSFWTLKAKIDLAVFRKETGEKTE
jgi:hypothetical protein